MKIRMNRKKVTKKQLNDSVTFTLSATWILPILGAVVLGFFSLLQTRHPYVGWSDWIMRDAKAISRGFFPYSDPALGYTGMLYTPAYSLLLAGLLKVLWWESWGPLINILASLIFVLSAHSIFKNLRRRAKNEVSKIAERLVAAFLISGFFYMGLSLVPANGLFQSQPDIMSWSLFFTSLNLVILSLLRKVSLTNKKRILIGVLLAASVLTKQNAFIPALTLSIFLFFRSYTATKVSQRFKAVKAAVEISIFSATIGVSLIYLQIKSEGFALDLLFGLPLRHEQTRTSYQVLVDLLAITAVPAVALIAVGLIAVIAQKYSLNSLSSQFNYSMLLIALIAITLMPGFLAASQKAGGGSNSIIPFMFLLLLIFVILITYLPDLHFNARIVSVVIVMSSIVFHIPSNETWLKSSAPSLTRMYKFVEVDPRLTKLDAEGKISLNPRTENPSYSVSKLGEAAPLPHISELLAAGYAPRWFIKNLISGKYETAQLFKIDEGLNSAPSIRDSSTVWQLNYLISVLYKEVPDLSYLERKKGNSELNASKLEKCFGPWLGVGQEEVSVRQFQGQAFICPNKNRLTFGPARSSEISLEISSIEPVIFTFSGSNKSQIELEVSSVPLIHAKTSFATLVQNCIFEADDSGPITIGIEEIENCGFENTDKRTFMRIRITTDSFENSSLEFQGMIMEILSPKPHQFNEFML